MAKETISKIDAIKEAIAEGLSKNPEIVEWIKKKHGMDVTANYISMQKGKLKKAKDDGKDSLFKVQTPASQEVIASSNGSADHGFSADEIRQVSNICRKMGSAKVRELLTALDLPQ